VDSGQAGPNKGLVIWQNTTPDTTTYPRLKRFIWLDTNFNPPVPKVYNTNLSSWGATVVANGSIGNAQLAFNSVSNINIMAGGVTTTNLVDNAVVNSKIAALSVDSGKIAVGAVNNTNIANAAVGSAQLAPAAVLTANIASAAVVGTNLANYSVSLLTMNTNSVDNTKIVPGSINGTNIANATIVSTNIAAATITSNNIASGGVTTTNLDAGVNSGLAKAWVRFNSSGIILASFNVSSVVKQNTGYYDVTMASSLVDSNYVVSATGATSVNSNLGIALQDTRTNWTSQSFRIMTPVYNSSVMIDYASVMVVVYR
jgi:hypothetical protein